jgi:hypothetical protein
MADEDPFNTEGLDISTWQDFSEAAQTIINHICVALDKRLVNDEKGKDQCYTLINGMAVRPLLCAVANEETPMDALNHFLADLNGEMERHQLPIRLGKIDVDETNIPEPDQTVH